MCSSGWGLRRDRRNIQFRSAVVYHANRASARTRTCPRRIFFFSIGVRLCCDPSQSFQVVLLKAISLQPITERPTGHFQ